VVFGAAPAAPTAEEWAGWCDTIGYEIVTRIGPRVPRVYRGGEVVAGG
jgi:alanine racemase